MKIKLLGLLLGITSFAVVSMGVTIEQRLEQCKVNQECVFNLEGLKCADGTQSFFTLTKRSNAKNVMIFMEGGGACWDEESCSRGFARPLTRVEPSNNWTTGKGIKNNHSKYNPFRADFNVVTVPYCTGDVHIGNKKMKYGSRKRPITVDHRGYENTVQILDAVKKMYPNPKKAVLMGCSAGGIGAIYHMENFAKRYPDASKYVISDGGLPFKAPYIKQASINKILNHWGVSKNLPKELKELETLDFGTIVSYNTEKFPSIAFGFVSSYRDIVMTFFSAMVGSPDSGSAVKKNIISLANENMGEEDSLQNVFYTESFLHCHGFEDLAKLKSQGSTLSAWLGKMVQDDSSWSSKRPDLDHYVLSSNEARNDPRIRSIEDLDHLNLN